MKNRSLSAAVLVFASLMAIAQRPSIMLTFTAENNGAYVRMDSIKVMNRTMGGDTVLYYPDTVLVLDYQVGIPQYFLDDSGFRVFRNYPGPIEDQASISIYVPEKDMVNMRVTDLTGRAILESEKILEKGSHSFRLTVPGGKLFLFTAEWRRHTRSLKVLSSVSGVNQTADLEYSGSSFLQENVKAGKAGRYFLFSLGDKLLYIGYYDTLESGIPDSPSENQFISFEFASNIPCPGTTTVNYEGQVYNTVQIFSQCWLKENLNSGSMISDNQSMTNNGVMEKYCYNNHPDSCTKYGGLYQWDEMMQYASQEGSQGICPPGWHLPGQEEWKVLEGAADSQYGIGDPEWDLSPDLGFDAGTNLKSSGNWIYGNGTDKFGFSGLPGGYRFDYGGFEFNRVYGYWWTSTEFSNLWAFYRSLTDFYPDVIHGTNLPGFGYSVRCILDK